MPNALTWAFLAALAAASAARVWLVRRQAAHVRARREAVPADFAATITLSAHQKAADYTVAKCGLAVADVLVGAVVLLALTLGGGIEWLSQAWSAAAPAGSVAHGSALLVSVFLAQAAAGLPLALVRTFGVEARFGFNRMTPRLFAVDLVKHTLVGLALGLPLVAAALWLMGRMGERWWLWVWALWVAYSLAMMMVYPAFILPLFNKFTPLTQGELAERVAAVLARCGFRSSGLFVMDGSRRSSHGNAFFTGFGAGKRIVLFDTLVERLRPPEVEAVLAHELGHYRLHHVAKGMALTSAASLAVLWTLGRLLDRDWFYAGLGVSTPSHAAALALFLMALPEFLFFLQPLASFYSRRREFEADAYAAGHAPSADLVNALVKLYQDNAATLTPDPLHSAFYDSHPPAAIRIARLKGAA